MTTETGRFRRFIKPALASLLALAALDGTIWALACHRLQAGFRDAAAQAETAGWLVSADGARWRGWPIAAEVALSGFVIQSGTLVFPPGLRWTSPTATLRLSPLQPTLLVARLDGAATLELNGLAPIPFESRDLRLLVDLTGRNPLHATASDLTAVLAAGPLRIAAADLWLPPNAMTVNLSGIELPDGAGHSVTPAIEQLQLGATIEPAFPAVATPIQAARDWREAGGRLEVRRAVLRWAALDATGQADIRLDQDLQPTAQGRIDAAGLPATLDRLVQSGAIPATEALAAKAMLAILAAPTGSGLVGLPISFGDGVLSLGRIPLLRLPPLLWE